MLGMRMPDGEHRVLTGEHHEIQYELDKIDWSKYAVCAHHTLFDGAILSWIFNVKPAAWLDTLSMARAMFGPKGNSLAALAKRYNLPDKGNEVVNMMGRRRESLLPYEFDRYAAYCLHDVDLCYDLFNLMYEGWYDLESVDMRGKYPIQELKIIDRVLRMFTEPKLILNEEKLQAHLNYVQEKKEKLLAECSVSKEDLMSNPKFAEVLRSFGVEPPTKVSPTTGKEAFAFAKTDAGLKALLEHDDLLVQTAVAARLGVKSTLEETRTERFIGIAKRSPLFPVPIAYGNTKTHRLAGTDKINMQNVTSRGAEGGKLKSCIEAPPGHVIIDCDSSQIEARVLAWLSGQDDLVEDFRTGVDVYCKMASRIYGREVTKEDKELRFTGKTVILGAGYGTGGGKLQLTLRNATPPMEVSLGECERIISVYRTTYPAIKRLWTQANRAIQAMHSDQGMWLGREGVVWIDGKCGVKMSSGLYIQYPQLHKSGEEWQYKDVDGMVRLYGAKLVENVVQGLARIIVMQQMLKVAKRYYVTLPVHDAVAAVVPEEEAEEARKYVEECMRWVPQWAAGCPINCESGMGKNYGEC
jgi:DNA polymerase